MDSRDYSTSQHTHSLYPQLYRLQAYLHQDWPDDYPDVWAAIDDFLTGATESDARRLVNEVGSILASTNSEDGLQKTFIWDPSGLLLQYYPPGDGYTTKGWLEDLQRHVMTSLEKPR